VAGRRAALRVDAPAGRLGKPGTQARPDEPASPPVAPLDAIAVRGRPTARAARLSAPPWKPAAGKPRPRCPPRAAPASRWTARRRAHGRGVKGRAPPAAQHRGRSEGRGAPHRPACTRRRLIGGATPHARRGQEPPRQGARVLSINWHGASDGQPKAGLADAAGRGAKITHSKQRCVFLVPVVQPPCPRAHLPKLPQGLCKLCLLGHQPSRLARSLPEVALQLGQVVAHLGRQWKAWGRRSNQMSFRCTRRAGLQPTQTLGRTQVQPQPAKMQRWWHNM
jgi:hypothetical protein